MEFHSVNGPQSPSWILKGVWGWSCNPLATWCKELTNWKRPWCWEEWRHEEKRMVEDEMVGWHHWLNVHEFEQAPGVVRPGSLACCSTWGRKELNMTEWLNWTTKYSIYIFCHSNSHHSLTYCPSFGLIIPLNLETDLFSLFEMFLIPCFHNISYKIRDRQ